MNEKKVLGIVCIILVVALIGAVGFYTFQISSLNSKVSDLTDIVNLNKSTVWVNETTVTQTANNYTSWLFIPSYAGYILVNVSASTTSNTYARVICHYFHGVNIDNQIGVGTGGLAVFPVLPIESNMLPYSTTEIRVGNSNLVNGATETVTITYHY